MKLLSSVMVVGMFFALAGSQLRAVAKEPTVDERFLDAGSKASATELPHLNAPQSKLVRDNPSGENISGPAYLGVTFGNDNRNAVVRTVAPRSPAEQAGLKPGDMIETLQGIAIDSPQDVMNIVSKMRPGTMLDVGVSRRVTVHAQTPLGVLPGATVRSVGYPPEFSSSTNGAPTNASHEPLPVPTNTRVNAAPNAKSQPNRSTAVEWQGEPAPDQRQMNFQNDNQSDGYRGRFNLGRRR